MKSKCLFRLMFICLILLLLISCRAISTIPPAEPTTVMPTAPSEFAEILKILDNGGAEARITAAQKILTLSEKEKQIAIPYLIKNLDYKDTAEVRYTAVVVLGEIGPEAKESVDKIILLMEHDYYIHAQRAAAEALGKLGDPSAIPALAAQLENPDKILAIMAAKSIALLTGENFRNVNSTLGYDLDAQGNPYIVLDARNWWESEGRFEDWSR